VPAPRARATAAAAAAAHDPFVESTSAKDPFAATGSAATATTATATAATAAFAVTAISAVSATTTGAPAATAVGAAATAAPAEHAAAQAAARNTPSRSGGPASAALNVLRGAGNRVSADRGRRPAVPARARAETGAAAQTQPPATTGLAVVRPAAVGAAATDAAGGTHTGHAAENRPAPHVRNATPDAASAPNADPAPWDARWDDIPPDDAYMPLSAYDDDPASPVPDERPLRSAPRREGGVLNHDAEVRNRVPPPGNRSGNSATALAGTASAPTGTAPTGTASAPTDTVPLPPAVSLAPLGFDQDWPALAASLTLTGVAYQLAFNSELTACEGRQLSLRVPLPQYAEAAQVARLKDALHARLGHPVELKVEIGAARRTAAALEAAARRLRQQEAEREIRQAPFVQSLIRDFDATIVPDSIRPLSNGAAASSTSNP
jgi:DNA polymerase-3 subunit gamma/tau